MKLPDFHFRFLSTAIRNVNRAKLIFLEKGLANLVTSVKYHLLVQYFLPHLYSLGDQKECNVCGWLGSRFLPFGVEKRQDAACPKCYSKERQRLLWMYLSDELLTNNDQKVLYFSPLFTLGKKIETAKRTHMISSDLNNSNVTVNSDITSLPFSEEQFDIIICSHVLEHVKDERSALSELYRVLSQNGICLVLLPQNRELSATYENPDASTFAQKEAAFGQGDHVRWYGNDIRQRFEPIGFDVSVLDYLKKIDSAIISRFELRESDEWTHDRTLIFRLQKA